MEGPSGSVPGDRSGVGRRATWHSWAREPAPKERRPVVVEVGEGSRNVDGPDLDVGGPGAAEQRADGIGFGELEPDTVVELPGRRIESDRRVSPVPHQLHLPRSPRRTLDRATGDGDGDPGHLGGCPRRIRYEVESQGRTPPR